MNEMRPLLLLSNDDGVLAKGLNSLIDFLLPLADIVVVAPDGGRSGAAGSITSGRPLTYKVVNVKPSLKVISCNGTPVDCVKLALEVLLDRKPDVIIGGINHGDNSSVNVHYSGTMGIVIEGCLKGIPSIGFSLCDFDADAHFLPLKPYVQRVVQWVLECGLKRGVCLNVNFPRLEDGAAYAGLKVCRMAHGAWSNEWWENTHPRGQKFYWLTGQYTNLEPDASDTDAWALAHGYVAVTPTRIDVTAYSEIQSIKQLESL